MELGVVSAIESPPRSQFGLIIVELDALGWDSLRIARHVGVDRSTISRIRDDPRWKVRWSLGKRLLDLAESVRTGMSDWSLLIRELRAEGCSTGQIARAADVSPAYVLLLEGNPARAPGYDVGQKLLDYHRIIVGG